MEHRKPVDRYLPPVDEAAAAGFKQRVVDSQDQSDEVAPKKRHMSEADQLYSRMMTGNRRVRDIDIDKARETSAKKLKQSKRRAAAKKTKAAAKKAAGKTRSGAKRAASAVKKVAKKSAKKVRGKLKRAKD